MTREQQVALDAMRSAWPEEVVQRMLRHAASIEGDVVVAALAHLLNRPSTLQALAIRLDDDALAMMIPVSMAKVALRLGEAIVDEHERLSPPETSTGASTPHPQTPQGEMP